MWLTLGNNLTAFLSVFDVEISDGSNGPDGLGEEMHFRVGKCISGLGGERGLWEGRKPTPCTRGRFYLPPGAFSRTKNHPETFYLQKTLQHYGKPPFSVPNQIAFRTSSNSLCLTDSSGKINAVRNHSGMTLGPNAAPMIVVQLWRSVITFLDCWMDIRLIVIQRHHAMIGL